VIIIIYKLRPFVALDTHGEVVGIERRPTCHGENFAVSRVHGDNCAIVALQGLLGSNLQIDVDGQAQGLARDSGFFVELLDFLSVAVYEHLPRTVFAHQHLVVLQFDSGLAHNIARVVELPLWLVQHLLTHFTDIADQMGHEAIARIQAAVRHDRIQLRQFIAVSFDEGQLIGRDVLFQVNRLVLRGG
jgi:hypothetical protein